MVWFKVDDRWHSHRKVIPLSLAARGLWATLGSWCGDQLNGGHVPIEVCKHFGGTKKLCAELVASGLWEESEGGFQFHDWSDQQPAKEAVLAKRLATKERVSRHRNAVTNTVTPSVSNAVANAAPDPTRPDPLLERELKPFSSASSVAHAHEEQSSVQLGHDLVFNATGLQYAGREWSSQLDRIGMKPKFEREAVLAAILADPWCKANKYAVDPDHVLKRWVRYAAGNKPLQPVATPTHAAQQAGATLSKLEEELAALKAKRRALDKSDPEYDVKVYEADRDINAAQERRDSARRKLDATG